MSPSTRLHGRIATCLCLLALISPCLHARPAYVVPVRYPVGNFAVNVRYITIMAGSYSYSMTVDSGSGFLDMQCNTPGTGSPMPNIFTYNNTANNLSPQQCAAQQAGNCYVGGTCWWSSALTGGNGSLNVYSGPMAIAPVSLLGAQPALSYRAIVGCSQSYNFCQQSPTNASICNPLSACPPQQRIVKPHAHAGIEFGFTFSPSSFPTQLYNSKLIDHVLALCYMPPVSPTKCGYVTNPTNSYIVMGAGATPPPSTKGVVQVPIILQNWSAVTGFRSTDVSVTEFRSYVKAFSVASFGNGAPTVKNFYSLTPMLWDSGAYGKMAVGPTAYNAYLAYYQAALAASDENFSECNAAELCGANYMNTGSQTFPNQGPATCTQLNGVDLMNPAAVQGALAMLKALYPPSINMTLIGGVTVALPTTYPIFNCDASVVAVCSYVSNGYPWMGAPFFTSRWVQFDIRQPMPGFPWSNGTMTFTNTPINSCSFLT